MSVLVGIREMYLPVRTAVGQRYEVASGIANVESDGRPVPAIILAIVPSEFNRELFALLQIPYEEFDDALLRGAAENFGPALLNAFMQALKTKRETTKL